MYYINIQTDYQSATVPFDADILENIEALNIKPHEVSVTDSNFTDNTYTIAEWSMLSILANKYGYHPTKAFADCIGLYEQGNLILSFEKLYIGSYDDDMDYTKQLFIESYNTNISDIEAFIDWGLWHAYATNTLVRSIYYADSYHIFAR